MGQFSIRYSDEDLATRLRAMARARDLSLNSLILEILSRAAGLDDRRAALERYVGWSEADGAAFDEALAAQRVIDEDLWR